MSERREGKGKEGKEGGGGEGRGDVGWESGEEGKEDAKTLACRLFACYLGCSPGDCDVGAGQYPHDGAFPPLVGASIPGARGDWNDVALRTLNVSYKQFVNSPVHDTRSYDDKVRHKHRKLQVAL
eukprot:748669-Hanusia_phi.AAC.1